MKRSSALAPLSRDHHHALVVAARLSRAARQARGNYPLHRRAGARRIPGTGARRATSTSARKKKILLPAYGRHGSPHHPLIARVLCEHVAIRALAAAMNDRSPPIAMLQELGVALSDHVRLEERSLFPLIEETVPPAALERLAAQLSHAHV